MNEDKYTLTWKGRAWAAYLLEDKISVMGFFGWFVNIWMTIKYYNKEF